MAKDFGGVGGGSTTPADLAVKTAARTVASGPAALRPAPADLPRSMPAPRRLASSPRAELQDDVRTRPADRVDDGEGFRISGLRLPPAVTSISRGRKVWFAISFLAPVIFGGLYLFLIAPDEYVTEYRFSVRVPVGQSSTTSAASASLAELIGGNSAPGGDLLDNYTVADYVGSSQAAIDVNAKLNLLGLYNKPFDPFSRLGSNASTERLAKYWRSMVYANYDAASGLSVVKVKAYTPQDSYAIATNLVSLTSDLVNSIGAHSQMDSVRFAQMQVDRATAKVATLRSQLVKLRRDHGIVDPEQGVISGNETLINTLVARRSDIQAQADAVLAQLHNRNAPQIVLLHQQIAAIDGQINAARAAVGGGAAGNNLAVTTGQFEDVGSQLKDATDLLGKTTAYLGQVQAGADAQRLYLTTYVQPRLPETPTAPDRWLDLLMIMFFSAMAWVIGRLVGNSILEHS